MRTFSITALVALAACNGGNSDDTDTTVSGGCSEEEWLAHNGECPGDDDTGTDPTGFATIKVTQATFLSFPDDCDVIVDEVLAGDVGDEIEVEADHTHSVGVGAIGTGFITHTLTEAWSGDSTWAGATVITPEWDVKLDPDAVDEREVEFNLYPFHANDWWSCTNDKNTSLVETQIAETDGAQFYLPSPGFMTLTGITLTKDGYADAVFTSIATAVFTSEHPDGDIHYNCYTSDDEGNPVEPPEE